MKATTFNLESSALQTAKALAEKALESLTSTTTIIILGLIALFAIMEAVVNNHFTGFHFVAIILFGVAVALSMTVDIEKGGVA